MDLKTYQSHAIKTAIFPREHALAYLTLGLCGEIAEFLELTEDPIDQRAKFGPELGDVLWYCAVLADHLKGELHQPAGVFFQYQGDVRRMASAMAMHAGVIANKAKKTIRDGRSLDIGYVVTMIDLIIHAVGAVCALNNTTLEVIAHENIEKLKSRQARGVLTGSGDNR
jgi:hypothetical protein